MAYLPRTAIKRRNGLTGLVVALFLFGLSFLFIAIFVYPGWRARLTGVETQATVVSLADCPESSDSGGVVLLPTHALRPLDNNVEPTIQFTDINGQTDQVQYNVCGSYDIGETLSIWYVPSDPNSIFVTQDSTLFIIITIFLGGLGLVSVLLLLWFGGRFLFFLATGNRMALQGTSGASYGPQMGANQFSGSKHYRLGVPTTVEGRWEIAPTNAYVSAGDTRTSAAPGRYFLILTVLLRNVSREAHYPGQAMFRLYDAIGTEFTRVQTLESPPLDHIQPGASASLTLAFEVPGTQRQFRLSYASSSTWITQASWEIAV